MHVDPGDIPVSCFSDWRESVAVLASLLLARYSVESCDGNVKAGARK